MGKQDIIDKVKEIIDEGFDIESVTYVPEISDSKLTFGNKSLSFPATVLYIDMRGSTEILNKHNKTTVAKLHMAYFHTIIKVIKPYGGEIRSFNGDSVLLFFYGSTRDIIAKAVSCAMKIKYMLSTEDGIAGYLKKYSSIDFGIGIDYGDIVCTKIGEHRNSNNQDIIWIGNPVNRATVISDKCHHPEHLGISFNTHEMLSDNLKYKKKLGTYVEPRESIWSPLIFKYNNENHLLYRTNYYIVVD